jgi:sporulation integral membrane protein YlbJ
MPAPTVIVAPRKGDLPEAHTPRGLCALLLLLLVALLRNGELAAACVLDGLSLCARVVVPSLFPFLVLSELLVRSGAGALPGRLLTKPFRKLLGLPGAAAEALLLGILCGFPVGARTAAALCRDGRLTAPELQRCMLLCNLPSAAFLSGVVGRSLFASPQLGGFLVATALSASLLTGLLLQRLFPLPHRSEQPNSVPTHVRVSLSEALTAGSNGILQICGCILFFNTLSGLLAPVLDRARLPAAVAAALSGALELTTGVSRAAALEDGRAAASVCALLCGWSGFSVGFQVLSAARSTLHGTAAAESVRALPYFLAKAFQGIVCAAATAAAYPRLAIPAGRLQCLGRPSFYWADPSTIPAFLPILLNAAFFISLLFSLRNACYYSSKRIYKNRQTSRKIDRIDE